eukprot:TRINITY_DN57695_c0_g1_i1.p1 TRINITY_DN57695_c0_g1~~TRINITY_DN57695_c0_g1_i1.p1  ORF type:complete len:663 (+),score=122.06 TRINITY_DN57695_c0_g1_i1:91-2079(+)
MVWQFLARCLCPTPSMDDDWTTEQRSSEVAAVAEELPIEGDTCTEKEVIRRMTPAAKALKQLQLTYPYLALPKHDLYAGTQQCEAAIAQDDEPLAMDILARIEQQVEQEEATLAAAFDLFKPPGESSLSQKEVKIMLEYLGFPSSDRDVHRVMSAISSDSKGQMGLKEFQLYVGRVGGSFKLFEVRRQQMEAKHGAATQDVDPGALRLDLLEAGILDAAQAYWRLVVPSSEFVEASKLVPCQRHALRTIRSLAKSNHEAAMPHLQKRLQKLGFQDSDLWMTLAWIREMAPIIVHLNLDKMMQFLEKDTHYRNQFETARSGGLLKPAVREKWERDLFVGAYDEASGFDRPKYGVLNAMNDHRGVVMCMQYGDSYMVLKDSRLRCTFSPEDSANLKSERLAVLDFYGHVLQEYSDQELRETIKVANSSDAALLGDSGLVGKMKYKEAQIHGEICFVNHVERLVVHTRHRDTDGDRLVALCAENGWQLSWMDQERARMEKEEKAKLGAEAWKERLKGLMEKGVPDAKNVPEGHCRKGCGRLVAPGKTQKGRPFTTCCRGCVMGFGHDLHCGNVDANKLGPGLCSNGCGRKVNPGTTAAGRKYDTCCRGCKRGEHDINCGNEALVAGMCRMGCGRKVAVSTDGKRKFDTCCRGCASGLGHSKTCIE